MKYNVDKALKSAPYIPYIATISVTRDVLREAMQQQIVPDPEWETPERNFNIVRTAILKEVTRRYGITAIEVLGWLRSSSDGRYVLNHYVARLDPNELDRIQKSVALNDSIQNIDAAFADSIHYPRYSEFLMDARRAVTK